MVAIGNPIRGPLHDNNWVRPPGNTDMRVTKTAAQHLTSGPPALDIGDRQADLDDILCPHAGTVAQALTVGSANLSIDFDSGGKKWRIVLAHNTLPHPVTAGQIVTEGQVVGRMGRTGVSATHLHIQLGWWNGSAWVWVDPWIYLRQNGAVEEETGMDPSFSPKPNHTVTVNKGARHRTAPTTADPANIAIASDPGGPLGFPLMGTVVGQAINGNAIWYAYWRPETTKVYYLHTSTCGPETPWEAGYSDADLAAAAKSAAQDVAVAASNTATKYP